MKKSQVRTSNIRAKINELINEYGCVWCKATVFNPDLVPIVLWPRTISFQDTSPTSSFDCYSRLGHNCFEMETSYCRTTITTILTPIFPLDSSRATTTVALRCFCCVRRAAAAAEERNQAWNDKITKYSVQHHEDEKGWAFSPPLSHHRKGPIAKKGTVSKKGLHPGIIFT